MKIEVDKNNCIGCGLCEENHPNFFKKENYTVRLKQTEIPEGLENEFKQTAEDCPVKAISIF
ncbi:MAG: ferredoxin [Spirochaetales bacterium]|nr:ferredoxin [Spirochaetales bacterium]